MSSSRANNGEFTSGESYEHRTGFHHGVNKVLEALKAGATIEEITIYERVARTYRSGGCDYEPIAPRMGKSKPGVNGCHPAKPAYRNRARSA